MDLKNTIIGKQFLSEHEEITEKDRADRAAEIAAAEEAARQLAAEKAAEAENARRREAFSLVNTMVMMTTMPRGTSDSFEVLSTSPSRHLVKYPLVRDDDGIPQWLVINAGFDGEQPQIFNAELSITLGGNGSDEVETPHLMATINQPTVGHDGMVSAKRGIIPNVPGDISVVRDEIVDVIREAADQAGIPVLPLPETAPTAVQ